MALLGIVLIILGASGITWLLVNRYYDKRGKK
jgi:hypothetical protein